MVKMLGEDEEYFHIDIGLHQESALNIYIFFFMISKDDLMKYT